jgi:polyhydroxyalkanoate synthesis regulator phasin
MSESESSSASRRSRSRKSSARRPAAAEKPAAGAANGLANVVEQLVNRVLGPLDIVMLSRDRIQETLDEAAKRGWITHSDANEVVLELLRRGRQQTDELLSEFRRPVARGRPQRDPARKRARRSKPVDQLLRVADRPPHSGGVGQAFPISGYDEMTASQVNKRLPELSRPELRTVREYESRHANRKSVLETIDGALR